MKKNCYHFVEESILSNVHFAFSNISCPLTHKHHNSLKDDFVEAYSQRAISKLRINCSDLLLRRHLTHVKRRKWVYKYGNSFLNDHKITKTILNLDVND